MSRTVVLMVRAAVQTPSADEESELEFMRLQSVQSVIITVPVTIPNADVCI